jgi:hypothetical protein
MKAPFALILVGAVSILGCAAQVQPMEIEYAPAPVYVEQQPYVVYEGVPTYYWEGRWYRRTPAGWGYFRVEPYELRRHRPYVQQAPPAYRHDSRPAYPANPRPNVAPPAHPR